MIKHFLKWLFKGEQDELPDDYREKENITHGCYPLHLRRAKLPEMKDHEEKSRAYWESVRGPGSEFIADQERRRRIARWRSDNVRQLRSA